MSESSLKRWCDKGLIESTKTPGGHRKLQFSDVVRFIRETQRPLVDSDAIGLPVDLNESAGEQLLVDSDQLAAWLSEGDSASCRSAILKGYLGGQDALSLCEDLITPAMHRIGEMWACGSIEVFQERRACEIISECLSELRKFLPQPAADAPLAMGAAPAGDHYRLATIMVELALTEAGWRATSIGCDLPFSTLLAAAESHRPRMFWLSLTSSELLAGGSRLKKEADADLCQQLNEFASALPEGVDLVLGGQALEAAGVRDLPGARVCANLRELKRIGAEVR